MKYNPIKQIKHVREFIMIKNSGLFDICFYLNTFPEIQKLKINPIIHFIKYGWHEGKNPSPDFDTLYYLRENKDVRNARINPLVHFIQFGQDEGRVPNKTLSTNPYTYDEWIDRYDTLTLADRKLIESQIEAFKYKPLISIQMPVYDPKEQFLREALNSLLSQCYTNWECCIVVDASTNPKIRETLDSYTELDTRFKIVYREKFGHIATASNTALSMASGTFIGLLDHEDVLSEHALYMVANEINNHPKAEIIYSDEDLIDEVAIRYDPYFKPDWNPELFYSQNLINHFGVFRASRVRQVCGFREGYDVAHDWDLAMRISEKVSSACIHHIPFILYHRRAVIGSASSFSFYKTCSKDAQFTTIHDHFKRMGLTVDITCIENEVWRVKHNIDAPIPQVSIIIPTRNQTKYLKNCLDSVLLKTQYLNYEIVVVDNQSDEPRALEYLDEIQKDERITLLEYDLPFNYSAINNFAALQAKGDVLVFLNNDIEVISPDWLDEMIGLAIRPGTGAVGAMLYYPNDTIQHAGVVLGMKGIAGHIYYKSPKGTYGQRGRVRLTQNFSAVTGACMAVSKNKFVELGGFNEKQLPIAYNDIDLCIRLMEAGYKNVWTPHAKLYHHESVSRNKKYTAEKIPSAKLAAEYLVNTWPKILVDDPAYNLNLSLTIPDFSLAFPPRIQKPWTQE